MPVEEGVEVAVDQGVITVQGEEHPLLRLYPADRSPCVPEVEGPLESVEILYRRLHVLVVGEILEVAVGGGADVQAEPLRPVDDESVVVIEGERMSLPAHLRRAEEVVEVGAVVIPCRPPSCPSRT